MRPSRHCFLHVPALWDLVCTRTVFTVAIVSGGLVTVLSVFRRPHSQATVWPPQWSFGARHAIPGIWFLQNGHVRGPSMAVLEACQLAYRDESCPTPYPCYLGSGIPFAPPLKIPRQPQNMWLRGNRQECRYSIDGHPSDGRIFRGTKKDKAATNS